VNSRRMLTLSARGFSETDGIFTPELTRYTKPDNEYRTVYGPAFGCNLLYCPRDDKGRSPAAALGRFYRSPFSTEAIAAHPRPPGLREGDPTPQLVLDARSAFCKKLDDELSANQAAAATMMKPFFASLAAHIQRHLDPEADVYSTALEEALNHAGDPHAKLQERLAAARDIEEMALAMGISLVAPRRPGSKLAVQAKVKPREGQKPSTPSKPKPPRLTVSYTVSGTLDSAWLVKQLKHALAEAPFEWEGGRFIFIPSATPEVMAAVFNEHIYGSGFLLHYHSDDFMMSFGAGPTRRTYAADISSCDATHRRKGMLESLINSTPPSFHARLARVYATMRMDIQMRTQNGEGRISFRARDGFELMGSGVSITTLGNNVAVLMIARMIQARGAVTPEAIMDAAYAAGYIITLEEAVHPEGMQFLKHSPVLTDAGYLPLLNAGVVMRASGACFGELPGRGDLNARAHAFQGCLLNGFRSTVACPLLTALSARVPPGVAPLALDATVRSALQYSPFGSWKSATGVTTHVAHVASFARRYATGTITRYARAKAPEVVQGCSYAEMSELLDSLIPSAGLGDSIASAATNAVLSMDYGLAAVVGTPTEVLYPRLL